MPAPKGRPKPIGSGLKKGTKIKKTLEWEEFGRKVIEGNLSDIQGYFDKLLKSDPEKHYEAWLKLIEYFKPKLQRSEEKSDTTLTIQIKRNTDDN